MTKAREAFPDASELYRAVMSELTPTQQRTVSALLDLFLTTEKRTLLNRVETCSASTASRCLNTLTQTLQLRAHLRVWQARCLRK